MKRFLIVAGALVALAGNAHALGQKRLVINTTAIGPGTVYVGTTTAPVDLSRSIAVFVRWVMADTTHADSSLFDLCPNMTASANDTLGFIVDMDDSNLRGPDCYTITTLDSTALWTVGNVSPLTLGFVRHSSRINWAQYSFGTGAPGQAEALKWANGTGTAERRIAFAMDGPFGGVGPLPAKVAFKIHNRHARNTIAILQVWVYQSEN